MKRQKLIVAGCIVSALIAVFVWPRLNGGSPIQQRLHEAIRNARQVVVEVHSAPWDDPSANSDSITNYKEKVFQTVELRPAQRKSLLRAMPAARDVSDHMASNCIFESHHRIEIVSADGSKLAWEICFQCGEHFVEGDQVRILPAGWRASLLRFFESQNIRTNVPRTSSVGASSL
jgi:hypothetical protein